MSSTQPPHLPEIVAVIRPIYFVALLIFLLTLRRRMRCRGSFFLANWALVALLLISTCSAAWSQTYKVLHSFNTNNGDGYFPQTGVIFDAQGNLYGTAADGGLPLCHVQGCGTVYELTPNGDGTWSESLIHEFTGSDGRFPVPLIFDTAGNLLGVAASGGSHNSGTIYKLTPNGGVWNETVLHQFTGGWDGIGNPGAALSVDPHGHVYGSTAQGGAYGHGLVFALAGPQMSEIVLYDFQGGADGASPVGSLAFDADGNIYGATASDSTGYYGTVFKLSPNRFGVGWKKTILYAFGNQDRIQPSGGLIFDAAGNLYGTTAYGGDHRAGAVYEVSPNSDGTWTPILLYSFAGPPDGVGAYGELTFDSSGNLYGATVGGGPELFGTVYKLTPSPGGQWTETILYGFSGQSDGGGPQSRLTLDAAGNIYGTTPFGGLIPLAYGGVAFEITP